MEKNQLEQLEKHIKHAWIAGIISAAVTFIFAIVGSFDESLRQTYGFDAWALLDVAFILGLAYGIYRKNRWCALSLLLYFVFSKIYIIATTAQFTGIIGGIIFAYFYFQGTLATFKLHKYYKPDIQVKKKKGVLFYFGVVLASLFTLVFGFLIVIGIMSPETEVIPGKQLDRKYVSFVRNEGLIDASENIQYWYSDGFLDYKNGFYFFTNKRIIVYSKNWEEPAIIVPFAEIIDIVFEANPSAFEDSYITLFLTDESTVYFPVSSDYGGDTKYYDRLVELWRASLIAL